jgi:hypothetical protein
MGTRGLTFVYSDNKPVLCLYRQMDSYPTGHGAELADFLTDFDAITNGIRLGETRKTANGMGCLAAQLVAHFKVGVGGFYLYPTNSKDCGQEYEYHIHQDYIVVKDYNQKTIFKGDWLKFAEFCTEDE